MLQRALPWLPVIGSLLVYFHVLEYGFYFDDYWHLYKMANWPLSEAVVMHHGGHLLQSFNLIVWALLKLFGPQPTAFFVLALVAHLCSVRLIYAICLTISDKDYLAALVALLWGMCPFAEGSLGWISVHGHVYATTALLWVVFDVVRSHVGCMPLSNAVLVRHCLLLLVSATSFGTGFATVLAFCVVLPLLNTAPEQRKRLLFIAASFFSLVVFLYIYTMLSQQEWEGGFNDSGRGVSILLTSVRELPTTLSAYVELLAIGYSGMIFGPLVVGSISLVAVTSLLKIAIYLALLVAAPFLYLGFLYSDRHNRRLFISLVLLASAGYAIVSIARADLIQSLGYEISLGVATRYHYLPTTFLALIVFLCASVLIDRFQLHLPRRGRGLLALWFALMIIPYEYAASSSGVPLRERDFGHYKDAKEKLGKELEKGSDGDQITIANSPVLNFFSSHSRLLPGLAWVYIINHPDNLWQGKQVKFLEPSKTVVERVNEEGGTRASELIVYSPEGQ